MNISITTDADYITNCILANYEWLTDDGTPEQDFYFPPFGDGILWVKVEDFGVFLLEKKNHVMYEVHTVLLPNAHGRAIEIGKAALDWAWNNTSAQRIVTTVPEYNPLALRLALRVGFTVYGLNPLSFSKDGVLFDQTLLGLSRPIILKE